MDMLFELIKSLSKSEKRYFRLYTEKQSKRDGGSMYIHLFDAIDNMAEYDEAKLKQTINNTRILKHFNTNKYYLYNLILKNLTLFHSDMSANMQIKQQIMNAEVLLWKGLYKQALKVLKSAKKKAYLYESNFLIMEIIYLETKINGLFVDVMNSRKQLKERMAEEMKMKERYIQQSELTNYRVRLVLEGRTGGFPRNKDEMNRYNSILKKLTGIGEYETFKSRYDYHLVKGLALAYTGNAQDSLLESEALIRLMEDFPHQIKEEVSRYIVPLNNIIFNLVMDKRDKEAWLYLDKLKSVKTALPLIQAWIFFMVSFHEMNLHLMARNYQKGIGMAEQVITGLNQHKKLLRHEHSLLLKFLLSQIYFFASDYSNSLHWVNKILNEENKIIRQDVRFLALLVNLILHYEMRNWELMEYLLISTYRQLKKKKRLYKTEAAVISFIRSVLINPYSHDLLIQEMKKLKENLVSLSKDPYEKQLLSIFDFTAWLDSKIENPIFPVIKERYFGEVRSSGGLKKI